MTFADVTVYKLTYNTSYPGEPNEILASGALIVPDQMDSFPMLSVQHGTIIDPSAIPSFFGDTSENSFAALLSGLGFCVIT